MLEFTKEQLRELQLKELELLDVFKSFCEEHNLTFYFCGGCCIGALRHKGFVPWDDDIDIFMPRDDYEKLYDLWTQYGDNEKYPLLRTTKEFFSGNIFTTIVDSSTTWIKPDFVNLDIPLGVPMDIFPLDGCPSGKFARRIQIVHALLFSLYNAQVIPRNHGGLIAAASRFMLAIVPKKLRYRLWRYHEKAMTKYSFKESEYITELTAGPHYMRNIYPKSAFTGVAYKEFEGRQMPLPGGYDKYLKIAFGDYMEMPPRDKQKPHHDIVYGDANKSYKEFKGIYYCVGNADKDQ